MAARSLVLAAAFSVFAAVPLAAPTALFAQDVVQPEVANSKYQFSGLVNAANVYVRSGPGDNYYPAAKLDKGTPLTVVGYKFEWLKVVPPEGAFSVVSKAFIQREGETNVGRVNADTLNVRAGSSLVPLKVTVQCKLKRGDAVTILGEQDEYYQIKPPADAYLYVHQRYVEAVKQVGEGKAPERTSDNKIVAKTPDGPEAVPTTQPVNQVVIAPSTQPAGPDPVAERIKAETEFDRLESAVKSALALPLDQQPLAQLLADYEKLGQSAQLPASMRRMADIRTASLRVKHGAQAELLVMRKQQEESAARLATIQQERQVVEAKLAGVEAYAAIGALQASGVQFGDTTIYRLTDPASGRTVCYLRSNDAIYVGLMGKMVGIKGELTTEPQLGLRVIQATSAAVVDPAKINKAYTAQVVPQSMLNTKAETAHTEQN